MARQLCEAVAASHPGPVEEDPVLCGAGLQMASLQQSTSLQPSARLAAHLKFFPKFLLRPEKRDKNPALNSQLQMSSQINKSYPLAALLINATNQEVTKEKMGAVFSALNLEFSSKVASMFCLSADKYKDMISSIGSSTAPAVSSHPADAAPVEEEAPKEESSEDMVLDF